MILNVLERLCTASDHRFHPLCALIARQDAWWRGNDRASEYHRRLRRSYCSGMNDLPFVAKPTVVQQVLAKDVRNDRPVEANSF